MRRTAIFLVLNLGLAFQLFAYQGRNPCLKEIRLSLPLESAKAYEIGACDKSQIQLELVRLALEENDSELVQQEMSAINWNQTSEILSKDHRRGDGDAPLPQHEISALQAFYEEEEMVHKSIDLLEITDSSMGGTSVANILIFYSKDFTQLFTIRKTVYVE